VPVVTTPRVHPIVRAVVRRNSGKIRRCYEKGLRHHPGLQGRVVIEMKVDSDGEVDAARDAGSTLGDYDVIECIVDVMEDLDFNHPVGSRVVYPFELAPGWRG
jgi:hypothetical protein